MKLLLTIERKVIMLQVPQNGHVDTEDTKMCHGLNTL